MQPLIANFSMTGGKKEKKKKKELRKKNFLLLCFAFHPPQYGLSPPLCHSGVALHSVEGTICPRGCEEQSPTHGALHKLKDQRE